MYVLTCQYIMEFSVMFHQLQSHQDQEVEESVAYRTIGYLFYMCDLSDVSKFLSFSEVMRLQCVRHDMFFSCYIPNGQKCGYNIKHMSPI